MQLLAVTSTLDGLHQKIFGRNKGQIFSDRLCGYLFVDMQSVGNVLRQTKNRICTQKALRQRNTTVCRIVQSAFQPLNRSGHGCVD